MIINFLCARIRSLACSFRGLKELLVTQPHAQIHAVATLAVLILGRILHLRRWEWVAILLCIGIVWMTEALNTAIEILGDEISLEHRERIRRAKDVAAAGVLIVATISMAVAAMIFWNHLR